VIKIDSTSVVLPMNPAFGHDRIIRRARRHPPATSHPLSIPKASTFFVFFYFLGFFFCMDSRGGGYNKGCWDSNSFDDAFYDAGLNQRRRA